MKSSCIEHPSNQPLIIIRQWQVKACGGNTCAAALLSFFEYWHNIRLEQSTKSKQANEIASSHGEAPSQDESLLQFHNTKELELAILGIGKRHTIRDGIKELVKLEFITVHSNPNPRLKFDQTRYFLFHPEVVNKCIKANFTDGPKKDNASAENGRPPATKGQPPADNGASSKETTSETTSKEVPAASAVAETPKPETDHQRLSRLFCEAYEQRFGLKYDYKGARDGKAVKDLLSGGRTVEQVMILATKAWQSEGWQSKNHATTLHGLETYWNQINLENSNGHQNSKPNPNQRPDRNVGTLNAGTDGSEYEQHVRMAQARNFQRSKP